MAGNKSMGPEYSPRFVHTRANTCNYREKNRTRTGTSRGFRYSCCSCCSTEHWILFGWGLYTNRPGSLWSRCVSHCHPQPPSLVSGLIVARLLFGTGLRGTSKTGTGLSTERCTRRTSVSLCCGATAYTAPPFLRSILYVSVHGSAFWQEEKEDSSSRT